MKTRATRARWTTGALLAAAMGLSCGNQRPGAEALPPEGLSDTGPQPAAEPTASLFPGQLDGRVAVLGTVDVGVVVGSGVDPSSDAPPPPDALGLGRGL